MTRRLHSACQLLGLAAAALGSSTLFASVARACPMCFNGADSNSAAFLYGSLFLMIVPVTAIGTLLYLAYKRTKALEAPAPAPPRPETTGDGAEPKPALRLIRD